MNPKGPVKGDPTVFERRLLFGEVKSSLGAYPGLSKTSYLACKMR